MILNLTQHQATPEQIAAGVVDMRGDDRIEMIRLLTFNSLPTARQIANAAGLLADLAYKNGATSAMIGGAPFLMSALERALAGRSIAPLYAFSVRESVETMVDGAVRKTAIFRHNGFIYCDTAQ